MFSTNKVAAEGVRWPEYKYLSEALETFYHH